MDKIKISSLGILDEQKFKKLASDRENWLNSGENMIINNDYKINNLAKELQPFRIIVSVKKIIKENDSCKTIVLINSNENILPMFRSGQKIALTVNINGNYYTRAYTISSSPSQSKNGVYNITIKDDGDIVNNYLYKKVKVGEKFSISNPFGNFYYDSIRDQKKVVAIVSDKGILPIYSMVQSIIEGLEDFKLTIFYNEKKESDFLFLDELKDYDDKSSNIKVKFVLSEEDKDGYLNGFVSIDKIKEEYDEGNTSFFVAGSEGLLKYIDKELEELSLPRKFVKYDSFLPRCNIKKIIEYNMAVYIDGERFEMPCYNNKTIMESLEEGGIYIPSKCMDGSCGFCNSELVKGEVKIVNDKRSQAMKRINYIHPCATYPLSDIEIIVR